MQGMQPTLHSEVRPLGKMRQQYIPLWRAAGYRAKFRGLLQPDGRGPDITATPEQELENAEFNAYRFFGFSRDPSANLPDASLYF